MQLQEISDAFLNELTLASQGNQTSLPYIPHALSTTSIADEDEIFQVFVIGGTVFRKASVKKEKKSITILYHETLTQQKFPTKESLFEFLRFHLDPKVTKLAINFAYPLLPQTSNGVLDGMLVSGSKESDFTGLVGKLVAQELKAYFLSELNVNLTISIANDTICLLLSGLTRYSSSQLACGVVGTGVNFALFEQDNKAINLESANFNKFNQSESGKYVDDHSVIPGVHRFEKEVSGEYLYRHFNYLLSKMDISRAPLQNTKELDDIALSSDSSLSDIANKLLRYSAELTATQIAGIMRFLKRDLTFIMIGSLFWKAHLYKEIIIETAKSLAPLYTPTFIQIENADILGAAKLLA